MSFPKNEPPQISTHSRSDRRGFIKTAGYGAALAGSAWLFPDSVVGQDCASSKSHGWTPSDKDKEFSLKAYDVRSPIVRPLDNWLYTIHMPSEYPSSWLFGFDNAPAIPSDFFGIGSDPWIGAISCVGVPLDSKGPNPTADLVVRHETIDWIPNPNGAAGPPEIPRNPRFRCEMHQLSERSAEPLSVTYDQGKRTERWDVAVRLAKHHPGGGHVDIQWINADGNGGLCDIEIAVKVDFTFTLQSPDGGKKQLMLTSPVEWLSETNHSFLRRADAAMKSRFVISPSADGNFIPAAANLGPVLEGRGACSKNRQVAHSFTLAPQQVTGEWGTSSVIRRFPPREG
jgi:hypothetical protein